MNVLRVEKDAQGHVRELVPAVGVELDAAGKILRSQNTYSSEPAYLAKPRDDAHNTLMELRPGGRIKVGRWGD